MQFDPSFYLVTDPQLCRSRGILECVRQAVLGGVTLVQLRDKESTQQEIAETARALLPLLKLSGVPLILNDHPEMVQAVGAQGAHIGHTDIDPRKARELLPHSAILGLSIEKSHPLDASVLEIVDYLGASPVFPTKTKVDCEEPFLIDGLKALRAQTNLPIAGIGGIRYENIRYVFEAGANGIAISSAILRSDSIQETARELSSAIREWRQSATS